jgi:redox-sensing transcriptional repressor
MMGGYDLKQTAVMKSTLGRLPTYLNYLKSIDSSNENISATMIAKALGLGEVQVRKDLSAVSDAGRPKLGYKTSALIKRLEEVLGQGSLSKAIIVGAGKLGHALLGYNGFSDYGLEIAAAFDIKVNDFDNKNILPLEALASYCREEQIKIGIITVPVQAAQEICDTLVQCGITAIWNFAPCQLEVPDGVILQNENLALSLAHLKSQMESK